MLGPAVRLPLAGGWPHQTALGGNHQITRIGMQRFGDQPLAHRRAIGVGGVDEIHAQRQRAPQEFARLGRITRLAPDALARNAHRTEAEAHYLQVAADHDRARRSS